MGKDKIKKKIIYSVYDEMSIETEDLVKHFKETVYGKFIKRYEIDDSIGGDSINIASFGGLDGCMLEFEKAFFVIWSCGEYIDSAIFRK